jgi:hypothetical protein
MNTESSTVTQPIPDKKSINLRALAYQMERLATVEERITGAPQDQEFLKYAKITAAGIFRVVVMGEIKKGKSSFINALTGTENLVPVHSDVATSTVFKIHYGPEVKYTVYYEAEAGKEKLVVPPSEIDEYGTEKGNPDNVKQVEYIRVESPAPILKTGLVIVDTPGVGGLFKKHREITWRHAPDADAVFFITESDGAPIGEDEVMFLKELKNITPLITFIQTKSSKAEPEARKARMENNITILKNELQIPDKDITYFVVDSKLKVLADARKQPNLLEQSGFPVFMSYLNNTLRKRQELHIAQMAIRRTLARTVPLEQTLISRKAMLDADTQEKRTAISQEIETTQKCLIEWEKESKPRILEQFKRGLNTLTKQAVKELDPLQPGGIIYTEFSQQIFDAESPDHLKLLLTQVQSDLASLTSQVCIEIFDKAKTSSIALLENLTKDVVGTMGNDNSYQLRLNNLEVEHIWVSTSGLGHVIEKRMNDGYLETAKTGFFGGMLGNTFGGILGGIVGSVIPVVGTMAGAGIGAIIGSIWTGSEAIKVNFNQKFDALKQQADNALQQALSSAYTSATRQINHLLSEMQMEATSLLQKILVKGNDDLVNKRSEVNQRQKATFEEVRQGQKNLAKSIEELQAIQKSLTAFRSAVAL